jgi:HD-GYP domain-containing protein (c-di-GMP phosphodiesterase class II)
LGIGLGGRAQAFVAITALATVVALTLLVRGEGQHADGFNLAAALEFGLLVFLSEQFPVSLALGSSYSVTFVITLAAIVAAGPGEAALASLFGTFIVTDPIRRRRPPVRLLFNASQMALTTALAGITFRGLGGPVGRVDHLFPSIVLPIVAASLVDFLVNTGLVSTVLSLTQRVQIRAAWVSQFRGLRQGYLAFAPLGLLLAVLYLEIGFGSVIFLLAPLLVARTAFQAAVKMQGAFDATVRSLVKAIEEKDKYTAGHAGRVADLSEMVAREYGLPEDQIRAIHYAALMHDVGKLGVETPILQKPGKLTPEEYERMKLHPIRGYEIVREIEFLGPAIAAIRHHHERLDGMGYPDGLVGDEIPLIARLIMVADAFDSMTSTRTYRPPKTVPEAFVELRRCAGTQFDERAITALERAIQKRGGWEPKPEARQEADALYVSV